LGMSVRVVGSGQPVALLGGCRRAFLWLAQRLLGSSTGDLSAGEARSRCSGPLKGGFMSFRAGFVRLLVCLQALAVDCVDSFALSFRVD